MLSQETWTWIYPLWSMVFWWISKSVLFAFGWCLLWSTWKARSIFNMDIWLLLSCLLVYKKLLPMFCGQKSKEIFASICSQWPKSYKYKSYSKSNHYTCSFFIISAQSYVNFTEILWKFYKYIWTLLLSILLTCTGSVILTADSDNIGKIASTKLCKCTFSTQMSTNNDPILFPYWKIFT